MNDRKLAAGTTRDRAPSVLRQQSHRGPNRPRLGVGARWVRGLVLLSILTATPLLGQSGLPPVDRPQAVEPPQPVEEPATPPEEPTRTLRRDLLNRASVPALRTEMALQRRLLAQDLLRYSDVRDSERRRWRQVDDLKTELDIGLAADELLRESEALTEVQQIESRLESAVGEAENATLDARELRGRIVERVRKIQLLNDELDRLEPVEETLSDPLTGRWEVTSRPDLTTAIFDLVLDGTQVSGRFRTSTGRRGSLRGRFTGRDLRLERIDRVRGFDAVFEGSLDPERQRLTGFWRPTDVSGGAAGGGDWWAERQEDGETPEELPEQPGETETEEENP
jgi:hypothetical protein